MNNYSKNPLTNISFFYDKRSGSGKIRGEQIGKYLGAKLNPEKDFENDLCIYVKIQPSEDYPKNSYLDIIDGVKRLPWLKNHSDMKVIASSLCAYNYLKKEISNEVILIPQHHCNFERKTKTSDENRFGLVGGKGSALKDINNICPNFKWEKDYKNRKDVVDAYKDIAVQVVWRKNNVPLKNPLKIINAMSFGIPTIAFPEIGYEEIDKYYMKANTIDDLKEIIEAYTQSINCNCSIDEDELIKKAEEYHIENISKKYEELWKQYNN